MIDILRRELPLHNVITSNSKGIYIVDYKNLNGGDVELLEREPANIKWVYLDNIQPIPVFFDGFQENALPVAIGEYNSQCECILFPETCNTTDWILFIETKYANNLKAAFEENYDYPNCMISQIIETVNYFRDKGIIDEGRRINAIVSFPNLIEEFNSFFCQDKIEDILSNHNILLRATNSATIKSQKRIKLNS